MSTSADQPPLVHAGRLKRSVGFYGLMFVSLGSIIGSGWLLGALNAAEVAGPASVLSWILAACMLSLLALVVRGARRDLSGGRRSRAVSLLLPRSDRRLHGGMGVLAAGGLHRAHRSARGHHLRQQRRVGQPALQHDQQGRRERRPAERHRASSSPRPDGGVHGDEPRRREVPLRQQRHRRHLEDGGAGPRGRCRRLAAVQPGELPCGRRLHAVRLSWRLCRADRRCRVRAAGLRAGGPARRRGARSQARSVSRDSRPPWRSAPCSTRSCRS